MKTGLGLNKKRKYLISYCNLFRFWFRKTFLGFESANIFLQRVDKKSVQLILKKNGADISENCDIESGLIFHNCNNYKNLIIGNNCHIGKDCFFDLRDKITIGDNVVVSMQCTFITHIDMSKSVLTEIYPPEKASINIKNNVYIGSGSQILKGVTIGEEAFVAAKSLVTKDIEPYTLVGGVPARMIKRIVQIN